MTATTPVRVVLASNNAKKLAELRRVTAEAAGQAFEVVGLSEVADYPEPAETADTFEGNALVKARAAHQATGLIALADDSGLAVDAMAGMPGVRSARWSGEQATDASNNELLLRQLFDLPPQRRTAQFVCAMALVTDQGEWTVRGEMPGRLLGEERGENGFGYDPLFVPDGQQRTAAELSPTEKDAISHRGKAVRAIVARLVEMLNGAQAPDPEAREKEA